MFKKWLALYPGARQIGEVALGCNYAITHSMAHPLLDEKTGGTFHIALGAANRAGTHLDLIADLRKGGHVFADGQCISINGRFLDSTWPTRDS
jgi:aminopeptidase